MIQRFLLASVSCLLIELAVNSAAGLFAPGTEPYLMVGCGLGVLFAALWFGRGAWLGVTSVVLALSVGGVSAQLWSRSALASYVTPFPQPMTVPAISPMTMFWLAACTAALGSLCGWMLFQAREPWPVAALLGSCILLRADVNATYAERFPMFAFGILCLVGITLAGRAHVLRRVSIAAILAGFAVILAWQLPTSVPAWSQGFIDPLRSLGTRPDQVAGQTSISLTVPFHPSDRAVMSISVARRIRHPYWWTGVLDRYDGRSWEMTGYQPKWVLAGASLLPAASFIPNSLLTATVHVREPTNVLAFPGSPASATRPTVVFGRTSSGEPLQVLSAHTLENGARYSTVGEAGTPAPGTPDSEPPPDLTPYLQLPDVPSEVKSTAESLTVGGTLLSKVTRVEWYLSSSGRFTYNANVGTLPGRDAVDYFLFHSRQGYCNQFATAMALMLREIGIPSRIVTGYASGTYRDGEYLVNERDGHSWVEAYVTDRGWIDFDPTPGFAPGPGVPSQGFGQSATQPKSSTLPGRRRLQPTVPTIVTGRPRPSLHPGVRPTHQSSLPLRWGATVVILLLASLGIAILRRPRSVRAVYRRMARSHLASRPIRDGETPLEYAQRAFPRPGAKAQAMVITELYLQDRYGGAVPRRWEMQRARKAWRSLRLSRWAFWTRP